MPRRVRLLVAMAGPLVAVLWSGSATADELQNAGNGSRNLPAPVAKALQDNRPGADIAKLSIEREHGVTVYDFEFKGREGEMDVTQDGTVLDVATIIDAKDLPEPVAATIRREAKGRAIKQLSKSEVRAEIVAEGGKGRVSQLATPKYVYEAEFSRGEIEVAADGTVIKKGK
jgi:hypothetical protein